MEIKRCGLRTQTWQLTERQQARQLAHSTMGDMEKGTRVTKLGSMDGWQDFDSEFGFFAMSKKAGTGATCTIYEAIHPEEGQRIPFASQNAAYAAIGLNVGNAYHPAIKAARDAALSAEPQRNIATEAWNVLQQKAHGNLEAQRYSLNSAWRKLEMAPGETVMEYMSRGMGMKARLFSIGTKIEDKDAVREGVQQRRRSRHGTDSANGNHVLHGGYRGQPQGQGADAPHGGRRTAQPHRPCAL